MEEFKMKKFTFISMIICALALGFSFVNAQSKTASLNDEVVTDIDGNTYTTVTIGTQTWLVENLRTTKYRNGDIIGTTTTVNYSAEAEPKYQFAYSNNENNVANYGRLYTWFAATDPRGIAPVGYRVPTDQDLITLATYLIENGNIYSFDGLKNTGTVDADNKILKALSSTSFWTSTATVGTPGNDKPANNVSGFNLTPGGIRRATSGFTYSNTGAYIWTSNEISESPANAIARWSFYNNSFFNTRPLADNNSNNKKHGLSIKCIKGEITTFSHTAMGEMNLTLYPTIVKDKLTIEFSNSMQANVSVEIVSVDGKLVYKNDYRSNSVHEKISIDVAHFNQGIYLCKVQGGKNTNVLKFAK
jgi:uncharacterized protein (TIGR02145 family)